MEDWAEKEAAIQRAFPSYIHRRTSRTSKTRRGQFEFTSVSDRWQGWSGKDEPAEEGAAGQLSGPGQRLARPVDPVPQENGIERRGPSTRNFIKKVALQEGPSGSHAAPGSLGFAFSLFLQKGSLSSSH